MTHSNSDMRWHTFLFDLDGTLINSENVAGDAIQAVFLRNKLPFEERHRHVVVGRTWASAVIDFCQEFPQLSLKIG